MSNELPTPPVDKAAEEAEPLIRNVPISETKRSELEATGRVSYAGSFPFEPKPGQIWRLIEDPAEPELLAEVVSAQKEDAESPRTLVELRLIEPSRRQRAIEMALLDSRQIGLAAGDKVASLDPDDAYVYNVVRREGTQVFIARPGDSVKNEADLVTKLVEEETLFDVQRVAQHEIELEEKAKEEEAN